MKNQTNYVEKCKQNLKYSITNQYFGSGINTNDKRVSRWYNNNGFIL